MVVTSHECLSRRRIEPRDRRRAGVAHRGGDRAGARRGGGAAGVRFGVADAGGEPRCAVGGVARFGARRCGVRVAATGEAEGDVGGGGALAGAGDRCLHVGIPADRRAAAAAAAGGAFGAAVHAVSRGDRDSTGSRDGRRLGVSGVPADARGGEGSGRIDRGLVCRTGGRDLQVGPGDGEGVPAICFGLDVRSVRNAAGAGAAVHRERRFEAGRASVRGALARLLDAPLRAGSGQ